MLFAWIIKNTKVVITRNPIRAAFSGLQIIPVGAALILVYMIAYQKNRLIEKIIFRTAIRGSFPRNTVYCENISDADKERFKEYLIKKLRENLSYICQHADSYTDEDHYSLLITFATEISNDFSKSLNRQRFTLGTAQKMMNLFWKMKWVFSNDIPTPIHCPFDGIIIKKLGDSVNKIKWTQMDDIKMYKQLVGAARIKAQDRSIAEWELEVYNNSYKIMKDA
jgi:hypothetical protein